MAPNGNIKSDTMTFWDMIVSYIRIANITSGINLVLKTRILRHKDEQIINKNNAINNISNILWNQLNNYK